MARINPSSSANSSKVYQSGIVGTGEMANTNFSIVERVLIKSRQLRFKNKANLPYLSGDGFASLADLKIEKSSDLEVYSQLQEVPRVVYIRSDLVEQLLNIKKK